MNSVTPDDYQAENFSFPAMDFIQITMTKACVISNFLTAIS